MTPTAAISFSSGGPGSPDSGGAGRKVPGLGGGFEVEAAGRCQRKGDLLLTAAVATSPTCPPTSLRAGVRRVLFGPFFLPRHLARVDCEAPEDELEGFAISREVEPIVIPVTIAGKSYPFLVDTGSTYTVFDTSLASLLGEEIERRSVLTPAGLREFQVAKPKAAKVGRLPAFTDSPVLLVDLAQHREASGLDMRGCLGMDFLSRHVVRIDFDRGRFSLLKSAGQVAGRRLPLMMEGGRAWVEVDMTGTTSSERFLIDTGHVGLDSGRLRPELIRQLEQAGKLRPVGVRTVETAGDRMEVKQGFVEWLKLGEFEHKGMLFTSTRDCNAFSLEFCARYVATFDFPGGAVYLQPSRRHASEDQVGGSGLAILRREGKMVIEGVREGSPAA